MNSSTQKRVENVMAYVKNTVFSKYPVFIRNLMVMKYNPDLEWFNCASIAMIGGDDYKDNFVAYPLDEWGYRLGYEEIAVADKNENRDNSFLIIPHYDPYKDRFTIHTLRIYFYSDLNMDKTYSLEKNHDCERYIYKGIVSPFQQILIAYQYRTLRLQDGWYKTFMRNYLKLYKFYDQASNKLKDCYYAILLLTYGNNLNIQLKKEDIHFDMHFFSHSANSHMLYKQVYYVITNFLSYMHEYLKQLHGDQRERAEKEHDKNTQHEPVRYEDGHDLLRLMDEGKVNSHNWDDILYRMNHEQLENQEAKDIEPMNEAVLGTAVETGEVKG